MIPERENPLNSLLNASFLAPKLQNAIRCGMLYI